MNKDQENKKKDILNYESDYGKEFHNKNLLKELMKEKMNAYVETLNVTINDSSNSHNTHTKSNADNDYSWKAEAGHDLNLNWEIPVSDPIEENSIVPQLPKSNKLDSDYNEKELIKYFENLKEEIDTIIELLKYKEDKLLDKEFLNIIIKMLNRIKSKGDDKNEINR